MIRTLLTTTAVALLLTAPVMAQNNIPAPPAANAMAPTTNVGDLLAKGYQVADSDNLATNIIGAPVYTSAANDAERIGDINDIVLTQDGKVGAVVIGVGGFLGIAEKNVAVNFADLQFTTAQDNTERYVLPTTKDALSAAADFTWREDQPASTANAVNPNPQLNNAAGQSNTAANTPAIAPAAPADSASMAANSPVTQGMQGAAEANANANAATPGSPLDLTTMTPVDTGALTADKIIGTRVVGMDNQEIAEVGDIVMTPEGKVDSLLVDFGGFLGIGEKRVAVGVDNLQFVADQNGNQYVQVNATREQLDAAQAYDEASYITNRDAQRLVVTP